ncbi:hypothetical protein HED60_22690 [Planctomycetales bacterium ZRK34]|nr:hypothetical protein HED60_22690 [Planctomycetales bacterium ZRK34]
MRADGIGALVTALSPRRDVVMNKGQQWSLNLQVRAHQAFRRRIGGG